jgi:hypothetical protein
MVPTLSPAEPDQIGSRGPSYQGGYYYPQQFPIDFRPTPLPPDCYNGRGSQQHLGYSHYQPHHQQHCWSGHSHIPHQSVGPVPPGPSSEIRYGEPYTPSGQPTNSSRLQIHSPHQAHELLFHPASDSNTERR